MRIHTRLTRDEVLQAATRVGGGVDWVRFTAHGSRTHPRAFEVQFSGNGTTAWRNSGRYGADAVKAATWDEYGIFLADVFRRDPDARVPRVYEDGEHFRWSTGGRYDTLTAADQHPRHRWDARGACVTGAYAVQQCRCGALRRFLLNGYTWADVADVA